MGTFGGPAEGRHNSRFPQCLYENGPKISGCAGHMSLFGTPGGGGPKIKEELAPETQKKFWQYKLCALKN